MAESPGAILMTLGPSDVLKSCSGLWGMQVHDLVGARRRELSDGQRH